MKARYLIALVLMNLVWSATYTVNKVLGAHLTAGGVVACRYGLAALLLGACWPWLPGRAPAGRDLVRALVMGVAVFSFGQHAMVKGIHLGQVGDVSVLVAVDPLVSSLAAALFLGERIVRRTWMGFALGMLGVVLLARVWREDFRLPGLLSNALVLASFASEAVYSVLGKPMLARYGILKILAVALFGGTAVNLALSGRETLAALPHLPGAAWLALLYLAVLCTVVGYSLWYVVIRETPVVLTSLTIFVQPLTSLALAVWWLGEPLHWGQFWGGLAILAALVVGLWRPRVAP